MYNCTNRQTDLLPIRPLRCSVLRVRQDCCRWTTPFTAFTAFVQHEACFSLGARGWRPQWGCVMANWMSIACFGVLCIERRLVGGMRISCGSKACCGCLVAYRSLYSTSRVAVAGTLLRFFLQLNWLNDNLPEWPARKCLTSSSYYYGRNSKWKRASRRF